MEPVITSIETPGQASPQQPTAEPAANHASTEQPTADPGRRGRRLSLRSRADRWLQPITLLWL